MTSERGKPTPEAQLESFSDRFDRPQLPDPKQLLQGSGEQTDFVRLEAAIVRRYLVAGATLAVPTRKESSYCGHPANLQHL